MRDATTKPEEPLSCCPLCGGEIQATIDATTACVAVPGLNPVSMGTPASTARAIATCPNTRAGFLRLAERGRGRSPGKVAGGRNMENIWLGTTMS